MQEEVVVELRNIVRRCKFDFKLSAQQLITFCEVHGFDSQGIDERSVREEYTKDFIACTTPINENVIDTSSSSSSSSLSPLPSQVPMVEEVSNQSPVVDEDEHEDESSSSMEPTMDEAKTVLDDKLFMTVIDHAVPSTAFSIVDLIERDGFDEFLAEIEAELDLRADSKTGTVLLI